MSKNFEEQDGNEKHDEIAGAQSGNDCAQTGEVCSSERSAAQSEKIENKGRGKTGASYNSGKRRS